MQFILIFLLKSINFILCLVLHGTQANINFDGLFSIRSLVLTAPVKSCHCVIQALTPWQNFAIWQPSLLLSALLLSQANYSVCVQTWPIVLHLFFGATCMFVVTNKSKVMHKDISSVVWMFSAVWCTNLDAPHIKIICSSPSQTWSQYPAAYVLFLHSRASNTGAT